MLTEEQAIRLAESKWWEGMSAHDIAKFQLFEPLLCMPFDLFHKAVEEALGRSVWTHEFAKPERLQAELHGESPRPTMEEIINLIPKDKQVIICLVPEKGD